MTKKFSDRDKEGKYRPAFVQKVLEAAKEKPTHVFRGRGSLLIANKKPLVPAPSTWGR